MRSAALAIDALESSQERVRPPLKWAGGKRRQVQHIEPYWKTAGDVRLVEPFAGGLAVTLGLMPKRALLNDINPHLINFFRCVKDQVPMTIPRTLDRLFFEAQ